jgi:hypothetical protein
MDVRATVDVRRGARIADTAAARGVGAVADVDVRPPVLLDDGERRVQPAVEQAVVTD